MVRFVYTAKLIMLFWHFRIHCPSLKHTIALLCLANHKALSHVVIIIIIHHSSSFIIIIHYHPLIIIIHHSSSLFIIHHHHSSSSSSSSFFIIIIIIIIIHWSSSSSSSPPSPSPSPSPSLSSSSSVWNHYKNRTQFEGEVIPWVFFTELSTLESQFPQTNICQFHMIAILFNYHIVSTKTAMYTLLTSATLY